jgi:hypothetical protein
MALSIRWEMFIPNAVQNLNVSMNVQYKVGETQSGIRDVSVNNLGDSVGENVSCIHRNVCSILYVILFEVCAEMERVCQSTPACIQRHHISSFSQQKGRKLHSSCLES